MSVCAYAETAMSTDAASTEARNVRIIFRLPLGPLKHEALRTRSSLGVPWGRRLLGRLSHERTADRGPGGQESYHGAPAVPALDTSDVLELLVATLVARDLD